MNGDDDRRTQILTGLLTQIEQAGIDDRRRLESRLIEENWDPESIDRVISEMAAAHKQAVKENMVHLAAMLDRYVQTGTMKMP